MSNRCNGTVKWFNDEKGFGFIQLEDGTKDIFVHYREINYTGNGRASLNDNQKVSFIIGNNAKGDFAQSVEII